MHSRTCGRLLVVEPLRALARNKLRSGLAMLGITFAVATSIWVSAIGSAGTASAMSALDSLGENLVWIEAGSRNAAGVRTGTHGMTTLVPRDAEAIRLEAPLIANVSENVDGRLQVVSQLSNWNTQYRGVGPEYPQIRRWIVERGAFFTEDDVTDARPVLVIGSTVREHLFGDVEPVGEQVRIGGSVFRVIGVLAPKGPSATGADQDDTVMMPWTTALRRVVGNKQTWLDDILCSAVATDRIRDAGHQVAELLHERHRVAPDAEDDFNVRHPEELLRARVHAAETLERMLLALASLSLAVGGIGIMNVMLASVTQRTREIGVRVAIGATPGAIQLQFLSEAVVLTTTGGSIGVALGVFGSSFVSRTLGWQLATSTRADVLALLFAVLIGVCFGVYPAIRASRLDPIAALRIE
ncbi:MAG TPA: ABC transporter permease [Kofleriaceae bacterium]|jgi:putative ABC transport system permease protein|nr:ABC transporter permease [Kofleriaceae bacterium]